MNAQFADQLADFQVHIYALEYGILVVHTLGEYSSLLHLADEIFRWADTIAPGLHQSLPVYKVEMGSGAC